MKFGRIGRRFESNALEPDVLAIRPASRTNLWCLCGDSTPRFSRIMYFSTSLLDRPSSCMETFSARAQLNLFGNGQRGTSTLYLIATVFSSLAKCAGETSAGIGNPLRRLFQDATRQFPKLPGDPQDNSPVSVRIDSSFARARHQTTYFMGSKVILGFNR